ncbi:hypothetical protein [Neglectibacter sp. X58]|uniref:hypothetical protein n=1 Tax=unclassified Neglectibacter TaxID=2632164 RepID=UPI00325BE476
MDESRNSTFDEELLARCAYALGYDLARAMAVMGDAFARGMAGGFADMAAPAGDGVELVQEDTDEETYTKTEMPFSLGRLSKRAFSGIGLALPRTERREPEKGRGRTLPRRRSEGRRAGFVLARRPRWLPWALHRAKAAEGQ